MAVQKKAEVAARDSVLGILIRIFCLPLWEFCMYLIAALTQFSFVQQSAPINK